MRHNLIKILFLSTLLMAGCSGSNDTGERKIIIDDAHILAGRNELMESYREYNEQLFKDYQVDFRIITTESDEEINGFANKAFTLFEQENDTAAGRALLLVINTRQDLARLEVSMALEPV